MLPLEWLPGETAGLVPGEKLIHGVVVAHGSPGPCNGSTPIPDACNGSELELSPPEVGQITATSLFSVQRLHGFRQVVQHVLFHYMGH